MNHLPSQSYETPQEPPYESISQRSKTIGGKGANLEFLNSLSSPGFIVPRFMVLSDFSAENLAHIERELSDSVVAVRSSGIEEDHDGGSMAGVFQTHLNVPGAKISQTIQDIHEHSLQKTGERIPIVIQEMVDAEYSGVAFSYDTDENKAYSVIQIGEGNGESLVSGKQTGETYKIHRDIDEKYIPDERLKALHKVLRFLSKKYYTPLIDVEFAFIKGSNIPYILQVRPIVRRNPDPHHDKPIPRVMYRYARMIAHRLSNSDDIFGNMIDINPEELVGNQPPLIQSFFSTIFPESSLKEGRAFLGYGESESILGYTLGHPYISLKNDLRMFLPKGLPEDIIRAFEKYYHSFIESNPGEQSSLDSKHFPNTSEQLEYILNRLEISEEQKDETRRIFDQFFRGLQEKLLDFDDEIEGILMGIFQKISQLTGTTMRSFGDLTQLQDTKIDPEKLKELLELIKECTYLFVIAARGAFYFNTQDSYIDEAYFKTRKYEASIYQYMCERGYDRISFTSVEGFNFLKKMTSEYTIEGLQSLGADASFSDGDRVNPTSRFMVHRENIKYLFTRLFLILHNSISDPSRALNYRDFASLIEDEISGAKEEPKIKQREYNPEELGKMFLFPAVIHRTNHMLFQKLSISEPHFIGEGMKRGRILFVKHVSELSGKDLTGMILCIENATPEIDIYLPKIEGVLTKNGGPLAHITIRAREYGIPAVVGMGERFNALERAEAVEIDFARKKLTIQ
ncbi:MAG: hypothetical protein HHAS10_09230 [Candidatus Altimarinota bacterium]